MRCIRTDLGFSCMENKLPLMTAAVAAGTAMLLFFTGMFAAGMLVLMMIAMHIGVELERICKIGVHCAVRAAGYPAEQPDASLPQGSLRSSPNAAADENIHLCTGEKACQRAVALPVGIHNLLLDDLPVFNIIQLKLGGVAEVLKYIAVFIGNCDSHLIGSFPLHRLLWGCAARFFASFLAAGNAAVTKPVMAARDPKRPSANDAFGDLPPCGFIYFGYGSSGDIHLLCALLVGQLLQINEADHFIFIHRQGDRFPARDAYRNKAVIGRLRANPSASAWPCHETTSAPFPSYVDNYYTTEAQKSKRDENNAVHRLFRPFTKLIHAPFYTRVPIKNLQNT